MGRRAARALHLALSATGAVLYFVFVIPRWWVLTGEIPASLATAGRIATGVPIAAAAIPVALSLKSSLQPTVAVPELALRLRAWSAVLHVVAGALIVVTAVAEIWLGLDGAGPWLFGVYGAAGAVTVLAVAAFALSFTAEKPPAPPKPAKVPAADAPDAADREDAKPTKKRRLRKRRAAGEQDQTADEVVAIETDVLTETDSAIEIDGDVTASAADDTDPEAPGDESAEPVDGALRNRRPTGKRRHRLPR